MYGKPIDVSEDGTLSPAGPDPQITEEQFRRFISFQPLDQRVFESIKRQLQIEGSAVHKWMRAFRESLRHPFDVDWGKVAMSPEDRDRPSPRSTKLDDLAHLRESGTVSPHDFDLNFLFQLNETNSPLTRKHLKHESGNQAVVLTRADFDALGCLDIIHRSGERMLIEPESLAEDDVLILYPMDLGDAEGQPSLEIAE